MKTKDLSLASFVRPPEVEHLSYVLGVSGGWLKTSYKLNAKARYAGCAVALIYQRQFAC